MCQVRLLWLYSVSQNCPNRNTSDQSGAWRRILERKLLACSESKSAACVMNEGKTRWLQQVQRNMDDMQNSFIDALLLRRYDIKREKHIRSICFGFMKNSIPIRTEESATLFSKRTESHRQAEGIACFGMTRKN